MDEDRLLATLKSRPEYHRYRLRAAGLKVRRLQIARPANAFWIPSLVESRIIGQQEHLASLPMEYLPII